MVNDKILVFGDTENPTGLLSCVQAILQPPKHNVEYASDTCDVEFALDHVKTVIIAVDTATGVDAIAKGMFSNHIERVTTILGLLVASGFGGNVMIFSPLPTGTIEIVDSPFQLATVAFDVPTVIPTPRNIKDAKRIIVGSNGNTGGWVKDLLLTSYLRKCWTIDVTIPETALYLCIVSIAKMGNETLHSGLRKEIEASTLTEASADDFLELVFDHGGILPRREVKLVP